MRSLRELLARLPAAGARWRWWLVGAAAVVGTGGVVMYALFLIGGTNDASLRVEIVRTGLTVSAGTGGAVALGLNLRRQWHVENEAAEKQVTELYSKGVDQLATESAAARLGGLYALERLGQLHSGHRQTIVHFICAYLRMPYTLPLEEAVDSQEAAGPDEVAKQLEARQELQVRRAAQLILRNHLRPRRRGRDEPVSGRSGRDAPYWEGMRLDLTGATLIDFDLSDCRFEDATFVRATFLPRPRSAPDKTAARFERTVFRDDVTFEGSTFEGDAHFDEAEFKATVTFDWARFRGGDGSLVNFERVRFGGDACFSEVQHSGRTLFNDAAFERSATFVGDFRGEVRFMRTAFEGEVEFPERFERTARFSEARFMSIARFPRTTFTGDADFEDVRFGQDADFDNATFERSARFGRARFDGGARFGSAEFRGDARFDEAVAVHEEGHQLPAGWRLAPGSDGTWTFRRRG